MSERVQQHPAQHRAQTDDTLKVLNPIFIGALGVFVALWALIGYLTFF